MHALVTGANGLIGANLVRELIASGHTVRVFVRRSSNITSLAGLEVETVYGDVLDLESLVPAVKGCDVIFHTAAVFSYWGNASGELENIDVDGTLNVIAAAKQASVKRVVFTSSSVVMGSDTRPNVRDESFDLDEKDPPPYAAAKVSQEQAAFEFAANLRVELIAVCPTMSVGPHGVRLGPSNGVIISYLKDNFKNTFSGGCNIVSVHDIAKGHVIAAEKGVPGERYILGSQNLEWRDIHKMISELCGVAGPLMHINHTNSYLVAAGHELAARLTGKPTLSTREQAKMVGRYYWYDHSKIAKLGYSPRPARLALAEAISWLAASEHVSRETRITLKLSREVYAVRRKKDQSAQDLGVCQ